MAHDDWKMITRNASWPSVMLNSENELSWSETFGLFLFVSFESEGQPRFPVFLISGIVTPGDCIPGRAAYNIKTDYSKRRL